MEEKFVSLEDFVDVVQSIRAKLKKQRDISKAWELIAKSLMGADKK